MAAARHELAAEIARDRVIDWYGDELRLLDAPPRRGGRHEGHAQPRGRQRLRGGKEVAAVGRHERQPFDVHHDLHQFLHREVVRHEDQPVAGQLGERHFAQRGDRMVRRHHGA